jgi:hypothetical protein
VPVPVRVAPAETELLLPVEDDVKVRFPLAVPLDCGWKVTLTDTLCPAAKVSGRLIPFTVNSELVRLPDVTVKLLPDAESERVLVAVEPTVTFPKPNELGETLSCPEVLPVAFPEAEIEI